MVINENESRHGLYSLIERGLIPHTAKITFEQFPFTAKSIKPFDINSKFHKETTVSKKGFKFLTIKIINLQFITIYYNFGIK
jgi:hypothetical protein